MTSYSPMEYGAVGDGVTVDTAAIQRAIDAAHSNGGGVVTLKEGHLFISGSLIFRSNVQLHVPAGCTLKASTNWSDITERWPGDPNIEPSDRAQVHSGHFLAAYPGTTNIGISGSGTIDGSGEHYRGKDLGTAYEIMLERPFLLFWLGVVGVTIRDVTLRESACWTVRLGGCEDVLIQGVRIRANMRLPNADGIDLDRCRRCRISDCDIICADDGISLKSCREFPKLGDTEDVTVTNCVIRTKSSALVVGVDSGAPIRNVVFSNCVIRESNRGLSVNLAEEAVYENIIFSNIVVETKIAAHQWWGRGEPIYVSAKRWFKDSTVKPDSIRNVLFQNILCRSECGVYIACAEPGWINGITLDNVRLELSHWSGSTHPEEQGGFYDRRPTFDGNEIVRPEEGIAGFHLENASRVRIRNSSVVWRDKQSYWGNAVYAKNCAGLQVDVDGSAGKDGLPAVCIT